MKNTRITIKAHHAQYLELLASQMNCDCTEVLNHLLWEIRKQGFSFASPLLNLPVEPLPDPMVTYAKTAPTPVPTKSPLVDDTIQRMAALIEEF